MQKTPTILQSELHRRSLKEYAVAAVVALAISAAAVAPFFFGHSVELGGKKEYLLLATHDLSNHFLFMQNFANSLHQGDLYPRWFGDANKGYGIAVMNYYPPGFYYLTTLLGTIFKDWRTNLLVVMILALAASGVAFYFLARTFFGRIASAVAAVLYMLLPYHLLDLYWRGALPEFLCFAFTPLIFYFAYRVGGKGAPRDYAGLGLFFGLHLLVQLPVSILLSYTLGAYGVAWAVKEKDVRILWRIGGGMALGLGLSAIYWLPAALETKLVYEWASQAFPYHNLYINPTPSRDLFDVNLQHSLKLTALMLFIAAVVFPVRRWLTGGTAPPHEVETKPFSGETQLKLWMILCGVNLFMTNALSYDIGRWLPKLELAVPPFRWLALAGLFGVLIVAACIERLLAFKTLSASRRRVAWVALATVLTLNLGATAFGVVRGAIVHNSNFQQPMDYIESTMTPAAATHPEDLPDTPRIVIEPEGGPSEIVRWDSQHREIRMNLQQPSRVRLKTYNFPGWTARVDGKRTPLGSDADGIQVLDVPAGSHTVDVRFQNTWPRWAGTILTLLGFLAILGLPLAARLKRPADKGNQAENAGVVSPSMRGDPSRARLTRYAVITGLTFIAIVMIFSAVVRLNRSDKPDSARPGAEAPSGQKERRGALAVGSDAVLFIEGQPAISVATDERALSELLGALAAREMNKIDELVNSGRVLRVPGGTRVTILEISPGSLKVRIREGENMTKDGWVVDRWVR